MVASLLAQNIPCGLNFAIDSKSPVSETTVVKFFKVSSDDIFLFLGNDGQHSPPRWK